MLVWTCQKLSGHLKIQEAPQFLPGLTQALGRREASSNLQAEPSAQWGRGAGCHRWQHWCQIGLSFNMLGELGSL